jgi:hypothetical protein
MFSSLLFVGFSLGVSLFNPWLIAFHGDWADTGKSVAKTDLIDLRARLEIQNHIVRIGSVWNDDFFGFCKNAIGPTSAGLSTSKDESQQSGWYEDYALAMEAAERQDKMLFIYFCDRGDCDCNRFKSETLDDPRVRAKLQDYVFVQVPLDASIIMGGKKVILLEHEAFKEMLGKPGIAIVDFRHHDPQLYGMVVSTFPLEEKLWYTPEKMAVILELPPGTLTQRTLIYAVRIHPDHPASTQGEANEYLFEEAQKQSQYQADIRLQGHHRWQSRFQRITAKLKSLTAREVCAESWPGENLVEAAVECVRCWRLSDGHWSAVRAYQPEFGYDMKRGRNGVWYATGIFGGR